MSSVFVHRSVVVALFLIVAATGPLRWDTVSAQEPTAGSPTPRDIASLRREAEAELAAYHSDEQRRSIFRIYRELLAHPQNEGPELVSDLANVLEVVTDDEEQIGVFAELCTLAATSHPTHWRVRLAIAGKENYWPESKEVSWTSEGYKRGDQFSRGYSYSDDAVEASFAARDRVLHMQWLLQAIEAIRNDPNATAVENANVFEALADTIEMEDDYFPPDLNQLTDLKVLPEPVVVDYESFETQDAIHIRLDQADQPVGFLLPHSWEEAQSDRERWHWALQQAANADPQRRTRLELKWIAHLDSIYGISLDFVERQTDVMGTTEGKPAPNSKGPVSIDEIRALPDTDTWIELADGPKRIRLNDQYNPFVLLKEVVSRQDVSLGDAVSALVRLRINRHQLKLAAEALTAGIHDLNTLIDQLPAGTPEDDRRKIVDDRNQLINTERQLCSNYVSIEPNTPQNLNSFDPRIKQSFELSFRNATRVTLRLMPVELDQLFKSDFGKELNSPNEPGSKSDIRSKVLSTIIRGTGRLSESQQSALEKSEIIGAVAKQWEVALNPLPEHELTSATVDVDVDDWSKAWVLSAGHDDSTYDSWLLWKAPAEFIIKPMTNDSQLGFLADRKTGLAINSVEVDWISSDRDKGMKSWKELGTTLTTDENGLFRAPKDWLLDGWLICRKNDVIIAIGATSERKSEERANRANQLRSKTLARRPRAFMVTDRAIYRPGDTVRFHCWVRTPFGQPSLIADRASCVATISDSESTFVVDGEHDLVKGFSGTWTIPIDARLGDYSMELDIEGPEIDENLMFRVEEYRRPEFSVKLTSTGIKKETNRRQVRVEAKYLFGKPVTFGTVRWKLLHQFESEHKYPAELWDGLYGNGYGWRNDISNQHHFASPLRGRRSGGGGVGFFSIPPHAAVLSQQSNDVPLNDVEPVNSGEAVLDENGVALIDINSVGQFFDQDLNQLEVQVTDATKRTESATLMLSAESGIDLSVKTDRSFCPLNNEVQVTVAMLDSAGNPVEQDFQLEIYDQVEANDDTSPKISPRVITGRTNKDGVAQVPVTMQRSGPVQIKATLADDLNTSFESDVFVTGNNATIELPVEKADLRLEFVENIEGTEVHLLICSPIPNSTVLFFARPAFGYVPEPTVLKLTGHTAIVPVRIERDDVPFIFAEVTLMENGRLSSIARKVYVPPVSQRLNLLLSVPENGGRPGTVADISLHVTDIEHAPVKANVLVAAYDQSLDQLMMPEPSDILSTFYNRDKRHWSWGLTSIESGARFESVESQLLPLDELSELLPRQSSDFRGHGSNLYRGGVFGGGGGIGGGGLGGGGFGGGGFGGFFGGGLGRGGGGLGGGGLGSGGPPEVTNTAQGKTIASGPYIDPRLRKQWLDTAFFSADLETDQNGQLNVQIPLPDNLTTWKIQAWAIDPAVRVGHAARSLQTSQPIMIRPHVPRHMTSGDKITVTAAIYSSLDSEKRCRVSLNSDGKLLQISENSVQEIVVKPNKEVIVQWTIEAASFGEGQLTFSAQTDQDSDAAQLSIPVKPRGHWQNSTRFASINGDNTVTKVAFEIPSERMPEKAHLNLHWGNSVADPVLDALPSLIEYPHGCAEQTTNKFVPLALAFGAAQEFPRVQFPDAEGRNGQNEAHRQLPTETTFRRMLMAGRQRLEELQNPDGGWGWFSSAGSSNVDLTSQVVYGLLLAMHQDSKFSESHNTGARFLLRHLADRQLELSRTTEKISANDSDAFVVFVVSQLEPVDDFEIQESTISECIDVLHAVDRDSHRLSPLGIMLAGLAAHAIEEADLVKRFVNRANMLVTRDESSATIRINGSVRRGGWFESSSEALGRYLQLKLRIDENDPDLDWIRRGLLYNRRPNMSWENTRDTAVAIEALLEFLKHRNSDESTPQLEVFLDGQQIPIKGTSAPSQIQLALNAAELKPGAHELEIRRIEGPDFDVMLVSKEFTTADLQTSKETGPLSIQRQYYAIPSSKDSGSAENHAKSNRRLLQKDSVIKTGDVIEVELVVTCREELEYLMIQNPHPAGFESHLLPEYFPNSAHQELRDDRLDIYLDQLPQGNHTFVYQLRAEHAGKFWNNPATVGSMYFDQIKAMSTIAQIHCH